MNEELVSSVDVRMCVVGTKPGVHTSSAQTDKTPASIRHGMATPTSALSFDTHVSKFQSTSLYSVEIRVKSRDIGQ